MNFIYRMFIIFFLCITSSFGFTMEKVFYILHGDTKNALPILVKHVSLINILITQAYHIDKKGNVTGFIDPELLQFTRKNSIPLMGMITNASFDSEKSHQFLKNKRAQTKALQKILKFCEQEHLYGVQFDFETIHVSDKKALTTFYETAATLLHAHGLFISFAVVPTLQDDHFASQYQRRIYQNLAGAYDLTALGKSADFVTLMTYDQHLGRVAPGPIASVRWTEEAIKHTLQFIPAEKISLGIPTYSGFWYTGTSSDSASKKIIIQNDAISYELADRLIKKYNAKLQWNKQDKINYAFYTHNWLNEYIFLEDKDSFKAKLSLIKKYHLRGFSMFRVGTEDPRIWKAL